MRDLERKQVGHHLLHGRLQFTEIGNRLPGKSLSIDWPIWGNLKL